MNVRATTCVGELDVLVVSCTGACVCVYRTNMCARVFRYYRAVVGRVVRTRICRRHVRAAGVIAIFGDTFTMANRICMCTDVCVFHVALFTQTRRVLISLTQFRLIAFMRAPRGREV
jgi:hypothetical protein